MRILITGASGFVGTQLGKALVREGHDLMVITRNPASSDFPFPAEIYSWKDELPKEIDAVIHLAGESIAGKRWSAKRKKEILESRTGSTEDLIQKLKKTGSRPKIVIAASAIGFYGNRADEWLTESSSSGQGFLAETCIAWEKSTSQFESICDRLVQIRIGIVLERTGGALAEMLPIFKRGVGGVLGSGNQWMSWIHLDDLLGLLLFSLKDSKVQGIWNAVAPNPVTNRDFTKTLAQTLRCRSFLPAPSMALKVVLGEMSSLLLDSQRVKERFSDAGYSFRYPTLESALLAICQNVERKRGLLTQEHRAETWIETDVAKAFQFFSDTKNLERITPPEYELKVLSQSTVKPKEGTTFEYAMKCKGIQVKCKSHVMEWMENHKMASTHEKGPYAFWYHSLQFEKLKNGTLLVEKVLYRWKYGFFGEMFCQTALRSHLIEIFRYRMRKAKELLKG